MEPRPKLITIYQEKPQKTMICTRCTWSVLAKYTLSTEIADSKLSIRCHGRDSPIVVLGQWSVVDAAGDGCWSFLNGGRQFTEGRFLFGRDCGELSPIKFFSLFSTLSSRFKTEMSMAFSFLFSLNFFSFYFSITTKQKKSRIPHILFFSMIKSMNQNEGKRKLGRICLKQIPQA